jgi:hypothetical protein
VSGLCRRVASRKGGKVRRVVALAATVLAVGTAVVAASTPSHADAPPLGLISGAFHSNTGVLWTMSSGIARSTGLPLRTSSSPSVRTTYRGVAVAFQANTGVLWTMSNGAPQSTGLLMKHGTSPRGTGEPGDAIAFQGHDGLLWTYRDGVGRSTGLRMRPACSPDILPDAAGGFWIAYQSDTGELWTVSPSGQARSTGRRMRAGSSPALVHDDSHDRHVVAFQSDTGELWIVDVTGAGASTGLRMMPGTHPAIHDHDFWYWNGYEVAFQTDSGELWSGWLSLDVPGLAVRVGPALPMRAGTSPSMIHLNLAETNWAIAYQDPYGALWIVDQYGNGHPFGPDLLAGTSPSLSGPLII